MRVNRVAFARLQTHQRPRRAIGPITTTLECHASGNDLDHRALLHDMVMHLLFSSQIQQGCATLRVREKHSRLGAAARCNTRSIRTRLTRVELVCR